MKCSVCSKEVLPNDLFCKHCGSAIDKESPHFQTTEQTQTTSDIVYSKNEKWEYCAILPVTFDGGWLSTKLPMGKNKGYLELFSKDKAMRSEIGNHPNDISRTIASLGAEGWEMVGCGEYVMGSIVGSAGPHVIYFKRRF